MKKTLAILLACMLIVGAVFAMTLSTSAEEPAAEIFAYSLQVKVPDGADEDTDPDVIYVGRQPVFGDAEDATKITGYSETVANTTLTIGSGTLTFDPATGKLVLNNVSDVISILSLTGSLEVEVKGTNTLVNSGQANIKVDFYQAANAEANTPEYRGNLVIKGDGVLNVTASGYNIVSQRGAMKICGDVTINGVATGNEILHVAAGNSNKGDMVLCDNVKINAKSNTNGIRMASTGSLIIRDNVAIDIDITNMGSWKGGIIVNGFEMTSGTIDIDVNGGSAAEITGLNVQTGAAKFLGGKIDVSVKHTNANYNRAYGLFFKGNPEVLFDGAEINIEVAQGKAGTANGVLAAQTTANNIQIRSGKITFSADDYTAGFFGLNAAGCAVNISGGEISGTAKSFVYSQGVDCSLNITGGTFDVTSTTSNYTYTSAKTFTQSASASTEAYAARYVMDPAGKTFKATGITAPANVAAANVTKDDAPLTWTAVADAAGYNVYANGNKLNTELITATSWTAPVMPNTTYAIVVEAVNALGGTNAAAAISITTPDGVSSRVVPVAPTGLALAAANDVKAIVSWNAVEGCDGYNVYVDGVKANEELITATIYAISDLEAGKELTVEVVAVNMVGESEKSASIKVAPVVSDKATLVEVTLADDTLVALGSGNASMNGATGTIALDVATGTVTVTDVTGVQSILGSKAMTIVFKGTSTIGTGTSVNILAADDLVIEGDGIVNIDADKASYPILGNSSITFRGDVKMNIKSGAASSIVHSARTTGKSTILVKDNAVLDLEGKGRGLYAAGEMCSIIITDNSKVTINTDGDAICMAADKDVEAYTGTPGVYCEVSGSAKLLVEMGNCGIRANFAVKAALEKDAIIQVVFKDKAYVDINAPGQTVYLIDNSGTENKRQNKAEFTVEGRANVRLNNNGPASNGNYYAALDLRGDENVLTVKGGALELCGSGKKAVLNVVNKTTFNVPDSYKSFVAGKSKEEAVDTTKFDTAVMYTKLVVSTPATSDAVVSPVLAILALAAVAVAAAVVLRKKHGVCED